MIDTRLSTVMSRHQDSASAVAIDGQRVIDRAAFELRVRQWMALLEQSAARVWGVYLEDSCEFAALLMALWQCDRIPLLAGDNLPATGERLSDHVDALVGDFPSCSGVAMVPDQQAAPSRSTFQIIPRDQAGVTVLTSGSTGEPRPVTMSVAQLEDEAAMHEQQWRQSVGHALVIGTVTHQHVYGLIWRVLWPLAGGRPFASHYARYSEDLLAWARQHPELVAVTTPSHLGRLPELPDWETVRGSWRMVVSSTAPLSESHSRVAEACFGVPVTEIFGSSETGGIAWRQQTRDPLWQTLPGITVSLESADNDTADAAAGLEDQTPGQGPLLIRSPLLGHDHWFATGDRARIESAQRFELLGRVDRIAKIEGKRVSLTAMERRLQEHDWIDEARLVVLGGHRTRCAVVATLTQTGMDELDREGRRSLSQALRGWLTGHFEAPVLPRHWRFPDDLPRNAQGKVPQAMLAGLFEGQKPASARLRLPQIQSAQVEGDRLELTLLVQPELLWFRGHFPEAPVLPGVVQMHWAENYARSYLESSEGLPGGFLRAEQVKFQRVIQPGQQLTLLLSLDRQSGRLSFRYQWAERVYSSGRLVYAVDEGRA